MARLRNFEMLLFDPVALDAELLEQVAPAGAGSVVDFRMINDPFASLRRGSHIERERVALLMSDSNVVSANGFHEALSITREAISVGTKSMG